MITYALNCPICGERVETYESMSDTRADLDLHLLRQHPDAPDPTFDPRFPSPSDAAPEGGGTDG